MSGGFFLRLYTPLPTSLTAACMIGRIWGSVGKRSEVLLKRLLASGMFTRGSIWRLLSATNPGSFSRSSFSPTYSLPASMDCLSTSLPCIPLFYPLPPIIASPPHTHTHAGSGSGPALPTVFIRHLWMCGVQLACGRWSNCSFFVMLKSRELPHTSLCDPLLHDFYSVRLYICLHMLCTVWSLEYACACIQLVCKLDRELAPCDEMFELFILPPRIHRFTTTTSSPRYSFEAVLVDLLILAAILSISCRR